jgi:transcriptional regulator with XRE-family HTH domain
MYPNLKLQLWRCGIRQNRLAQLLGIHETLLSRILNGYRDADNDLRNRIAAILRSDVRWLFIETSDISGFQSGEAEPHSSHD